MKYEITCPYCFRKMKDTEVAFRSEKVNQGDPGIIPDEYDDADDFRARYRGADKDVLLSQLNDWEFFEETDDPEYTEFWKKFNGTTEYNPADAMFGVKAYRRKVIDPHDPEHRQYLKAQTGGDYYIYDQHGMAAQVELITGERCNRRVCRYCHNPLPDNYGKNTVKFATVVGITGAGKTVYLAQLLTKMTTYAVKAGLSAIVRHPSVITFLENNRVIKNQPMPGSTPAKQFQQPLFYEMVRDAKEMGRITETFVLYDVAGEVFAMGQSAIDSFAPYIEHADGVILLIDPLQLESISTVASEGEKKDEPTAVLNQIHDIISHGKINEKSKIPLAVCISKADMDPVQAVMSDDLRRLLLDDVRGVKDASGFNKPVFNAKDYNPILNELYKFFLEHAEDLAQQLQTNYASYAYFAFTALGCDVKKAVLESGEEYKYPVGPVLPKRVEEPLLWLFHKLGYIGLNEPIDDPTKPKVPCPECGFVYSEELPEDQREMSKGFLFFKKKVYVNRVCPNCGHQWEHI